MNAIKYKKYRSLKMADAEKIKQDNEVFCKQCGKIILANAEICPNCGVRQFDSVAAPKKPNKTRQIVWGSVIGVLGLIVILYIIGSSTPKVLLDKQEEIKDGYELTYNLPAGKYQISVVSDEAVKISYDIAQQEDTAELTSYTKTISVSDGEKLHITNPTVFGMGNPAIVSIKIIR